MYKEVTCNTLSASAKGATRDHPHGGTYHFTGLHEGTGRLKSLDYSETDGFEGYKGAYNQNGHIFDQTQSFQFDQPPLQMSAPSGGEVVQLNMINKLFANEHTQKSRGYRASTNGPSPSPHRIDELFANKNARSSRPSGATSLPNRMIENGQRRFGQDLSGINVFKNSSKPKKFGALAYAQGRDIHLAPDQGKHLSHEVGHSIQQMRGEVRPTTTINGMPVNDNPSLEKKATRIGRVLDGPTLNRHHYKRPSKDLKTRNEPPDTSDKDLHGAAIQNKTNVKNRTNPVYTSDTMLYDSNVLQLVTVPWTIPASVAGGLGAAQATSSVSIPATVAAASTWGATLGELTSAVSAATSVGSMIASGVVAAKQNGRSGHGPALVLAGEEKALMSRTHQNALAVLLGAMVAKTAIDQQIKIINESVYQEGETPVNPRATLPDDRLSTRSRLMRKLAKPKFIPIYNYTWLDKLSQNNLRYATGVHQMTIDNCIADNLVPYIQTIRLNGYNDKIYTQWDTNYDYEPFGEVKVHVRAGTILPEDVFPGVGKYCKEMFGHNPFIKQNKLVYFNEINLSFQETKRKRGWTLPNNNIYIRGISLHSTIVNQTLRAKADIAFDYDVDTIYIKWEDDNPITHESFVLPNRYGPANADD